MLANAPLSPPAVLQAIEQATQTLQFTMASDPLTGSLLRTLASTKPASAFLELGTGTGMGTAWILDGMDATSKLITVDTDERASAVARRHLGHDPRVTFYITDGGEFLHKLKAQGARFDFIFADTWPGKFTHLEVALGLLNVGGLYIVDDLLPQASWPEEHAPKVANFIATLRQRTDLTLTWLNWSTGLLLAAKSG